MISGDCSLPDLGISDDDRKLLAENISIVYHCAATVRFDETLKRAVLLNTRGTKLMLELSKTFKKLAVSITIRGNHLACVLLTFHSIYPPVFHFQYQNFFPIIYQLLMFFFAAILLCVDVILSPQWKVTHGKTISSTSWSTSYH